MSPEVGHHWLGSDIKDPCYSPVASDNCCGRFGLWPFRSVPVSVCGPFGLWPFRSVAVSVCGRFGLWPLWPVTFLKICTAHHAFLFGVDIRLLYIKVTPQRSRWFSNHQPHDCLVNRLFRHRSKKTSKLRVTGLCAGNSPVTGELTPQTASNAENVSIWWRHHEFCQISKYCSSDTLNRE